MAKERFIAFLDLLGFSNLVLNNDLDDVLKTFESSLMPYHQHLLVVSQIIIGRIKTIPLIHGRPDVDHNAHGLMIVRPVS